MASFKGGAITLTWPEVFHAAMVGVARRVTSLKHGRQPSNYTQRSQWDIDIEGAIAESAYGKISGQYWSASVDTFKTPDVGKTQIRQTVHKNGHLIVRRRDPHEDYFVLMIGEIKQWLCAGGISGPRARIDEYYNSEQDNWYVPQGVLE
jgi:hypothetical protein